MPKPDSAAAAGSRPSLLQSLKGYLATWVELLRTRLAQPARGKGAGVAGEKPMETDPFGPSRTKHRGVSRPREPTREASSVNPHAQPRSVDSPPRTNFTRATVAGSSNRKRRASSGVGTIQLSLRPNQL